MKLVQKLRYTLLKMPENATEKESFYIHYKRYVAWRVKKKFLEQGERKLNAKCRAASMQC